MNLNTTHEGRRVAFNLLGNITSSCDERELFQKASWAFGAGLMASALGATEASRIMFELDEGLGRIAYDFTNSAAAITAIQELKAKLEQAHG